MALWGDILEPRHDLPDVAAFEALSCFPASVTFWRRTSESRTRHRCPLLDSTLGITIDRFQIDIMHTLYAGSAQEWVARSIWALLLADEHGFGAARTESERIDLSVMRLRAQLGLVL